MISKETRDSLTKVPQRNGIFGSRPLDRDHTAQGETVPRFNLGRAYRIGRSREVGRAMGGADRYLDLVDSAGSVLDRGSRIGWLGFNPRGEAAALACR